MEMISTSWIKQHKWRLLLAALVAFLLISPIEDVFDKQDNFISPVAALAFLIVSFGTAKKKGIVWSLAALTIVWLIISILTDGSGLFAGQSKLAPVLFLVILAAILSLLAHWLIQVVYINAEVLCAAICGYLLLGILWTGFYSLVNVLDPPALVLTPAARVTFSDMLYFSYTTLTTTGYGDVLPKNPVARMLAVMEAVVGIFYTTIVIARFVGLYGLNQANRDNP